MQSRQSCWGSLSPKGDLGHYCLRYGLGRWYLVCRHQHPAGQILVLFKKGWMEPWEVLFGRGGRSWICS